MFVFVHAYMRRDVLTVNPETTLRQALGIMKEKGLDALPVLQNSRLTGMVTRRDVEEALASEALLGRLSSSARVDTVMSKRLCTVAPEGIVEEAAYLMEKHDLWALPVVELDNTLVGIITQGDIYHVLVEMLGLNRPGSRLTVRVEDRPGKLAEITAAIKKHGIGIISVATFHPEKEMRDLVLRINTDNPQDIVEDLRKQGFRVVHVSQVWG